MRNAIEILEKLGLSPGPKKRVDRLRDIHTARTPDRDDEEEWPIKELMR